MKAAAFDYVKPKALPEALSLLAEAGEDARLIAGGQTLLATLNMRLSEPSILIDITDIAELKGITLNGDHLRIGALVTHTEIEDSDLIAKHAPLLKAAPPSPSSPPRTWSMAICRRSGWWKSWAARATS